MANRHRKGDVAPTLPPVLPPAALAPHSGREPVARAQAEPSLSSPPVRTLASRTNVRQSEQALLRQFGQIVRAARNRRALSQSDLGARAKVHRTHVSLIESGTREAKLLTICALAAAMRMQPGDLMPPIS